MSSIEELVLLDFDRHNKGTSKQRRDQINAEISIMRDLLPLPDSSRQRLSQLQIMSLICVYIRKCNALQQLFQTTSLEPEMPEFADFFQAMTGFLLVTTREGKMLYISENVTNYLGHSMVDMKTRGDSLYDIVDKRDHEIVRAQLLQGSPKPDQSSQSEVSFLCRMNLPRTLKRQPGSGDVKVMHVRGHFKNMISSEPGCTSSDSRCVFMATCTPMISPDVKENLLQNNTMVFKTVHKLDMTLLGISRNGEFHLGCTSEDLIQRSWYSFLHPLDIMMAKAKHEQLVQSNLERSCMLTVRLLKADGTSVWVNIVMHLHHACLPESEEPLIVCINQVIGAQEANQIRDQSGHMFFAHSSPLQDRRADHLAAVCSPFQNSTNDLWKSHVLNHGTDSGHKANIPSYIKHVESQKMLLNAYPALVSSKVRPEDDYTLQSPKPHELKVLLKRKIQEQQLNSCWRRTKKVRTCMDNDNLSTSSDYSIIDDWMADSEQNTQTSESLYGGCQNKTIQASQPSFTRAMEIDPMPLKTPTYQDSLKEGSSNSEQIVPESYLTPDPSPVSSPEPPHLSMKTKISNHKEETTCVKSLSILQALEKTVSLPCRSTDVIVSVSNEKDLPVLDAFSIETFFDGLAPKLERRHMAKMDDTIKQEIRAGAIIDKTPVVNIPNFLALKDERLCSSPCFQYKHQSGVYSNIHPSSLLEVQQPQLQHVFQPQALSRHLPQPPVPSQTQHSPQPQARFQPQHSPQHKTLSQPQHSPQHKALSQPQHSTQPQTLSQPQYFPQPQALSQSQDSPQPQALSQPQDSPQPQALSQPQYFPQPHDIQPANQAHIQPSKIHSSQPSQIQTTSSIQHSNDSPFHQLSIEKSPDIYSNSIELCSNINYDPTNKQECNSLSSPESVDSLEAIDDFLSCLSEDGFDQVQMDAKTSTTEDFLDNYSEISFYMESSDTTTKLPQIGPMDSFELLSPQSKQSLSGDESPQFSLEMIENQQTESNQMLIENDVDNKYQDVLDASSDQEWNSILDFCMIPKGFLNLEMIKHSQ